MHYRNGTQAQLFDMIKIKLNNPPAEVTGILVSITPGATSCNGIIQFLKALPIYNYFADKKPEISHFYTLQATEHITIGEAELVHRHGV